MALIFGGVFNYADPIIGFPLYAWMWIFTGLTAGVLFFALWIGMWKPLEALQGLFRAAKHNTNASLIFDQYNVGEIVDESTAKCVWDVESTDVELEGGGKYRMLDEVPETKLEAILRYYQGRNRTIQFVEKRECCPVERASAVRCNNVKLDLIVDLDGWTIKGSAQNRAIQTACERWNVEHEDNQCWTFAKFAKLLASGKIAVPPELHPTHMIPWDRIDREFPPEGISEAFYAGMKRQLAILMENEKGEFLQKLCIYVLVGGGILCALTLVIRLLMHYG